MPDKVLTKANLATLFCEVFLLAAQGITLILRQVDLSLYLFDPYAKTTSLVIDLISLR
jgi:hypothetical protein